ncbi:hypothetical protein HY638_03010 [Candidatus Woesearchaeota archaeon]|nr:hypothetical protein [Candidatus Woesearchaeota archaeon]
MTKKSQITFFIIAVIVALLVFLMAYFLIPKEKEAGLAEIPDWAIPVKNEVESCMHSLAVDALIKMGQHGGYIDMKDEEISGRKFNLDMGNPTDSDAVSMALAPVPVPYWWHMQSPNYCSVCKVSSLMPALQDIEGQLDRYIRRNILECVGNFTEFKEQAFGIKFLEEPKVSATVAEYDIPIVMKFPVTLSQNNAEVTLEDYETRIDFKLRDFYKLGIDIVGQESSAQFLENIMMNLINVHSGTEFNKLPPIGDMDHESRITTWSLKDVKFNIENNIMPYFNSLQLGKTKGAKKIVVPGAPENAYNTLYLDFLAAEYPDTTVQFFYMDWPIYLDIHPRDGDKIKPDIISKKFFMDIVPESRTNYYEFFYSASFPVMVRIHREKVIDNEYDYDLFFAIEGNIRSNRHLLDWLGGEGTMGITNLNLNTTTVGTGTESIDLTAKKLFCSPEQRLSKNITVKVWDAKTKEPIDKATITFGCGNYGSCMVGEAKLNEKGESVFNGPLPLCKGGHISAEADGYHPEVEPLSTSDGKEKEIILSLEPYRYFPVSVKRYNLTLNRTLGPEVTIYPYGTGYRIKKSPTCCKEPEDLGQGEMVQLEISKIPDPWKLYEVPLEQGLGISPGAPGNVTKLIPGKYRINLVYINENSYNITKGCKLICRDGEYLGDECEDEDEMQLEPKENQPMLPSGGAWINETVGEWTLTERDLDSGKGAIEFYILKLLKIECIDNQHCILNSPFETPRCVDISELQNLDKYNVLFQNYLKPKFI